MAIRNNDVNLNTVLRILINCVAFLLAGFDAHSRLTPVSLFWDYPEKK